MFVERYYWAAILIWRYRKLLTLSKEARSTQCAPIPAIRGHFPGMLTPIACVSASAAASRRATGSVRRYRQKVLKCEVHHAQRKRLRAHVATSTDPATGGDARSAPADRHSHSAHAPSTAIRNRPRRSQRQQAASSITLPRRSVSPSVNGPHAARAWIHRTRRRRVSTHSATERHLAYGGGFDLRLAPSARIFSTLRNDRLD